MCRMDYYKALGSRTPYGLKLEISLNTAEIPADIRKYHP